MAYAVAAVALSRSDVNVRGPASAVFDGYTVPNPPASVDSRRVLLTEQRNKSENGIWIFAGTGKAMARPAPNDQYASANVLDNATLIPVINGTTFAGTVWGIDPAKTVTVDTDEIILTRIALPPVQCRAATAGDVNLA